MPPKTHITIQEVLALPSCEEWTEETILARWNGQTSITLESYAEQFLAQTDMPLPPAQDLCYILCLFMNRRKRLRTGYLILDRVETKRPNAAVRETLDLIKSFLDGTANVEAVKAQRAKIRTYMKLHASSSMEKYRMVEAVMHLMNANKSQVSLMRILRFVENNHPKATYEKYSQLIIKVLKEEI